MLRAREAFACELDGTPVVVHAGDVVRAGHPVVAGREEMFEPAGADRPPDIE
jgi:hypothetical protein